MITPRDHYSFETDGLRSLKQDEILTLLTLQTFAISGLEHHREGGNSHACVDTKKAVIHSINSTNFIFSAVMVANKKHL